MRKKEKEGIECRSCGATSCRLYRRNPMRDQFDYFCKPCFDCGLHLQKITRRMR